MKRLMLGNEAVARGLYEAGCRFVSSYPGTPSTEITEFAAGYDEVYAEWAPNEKVALESALGASIGGARAFSGMKHVGLNVAADPLFTASYTGVGAGLVIAVADDQGMHSSQNEQDSRHYAVAAKLPMLEPADSGECRDYAKLAYELSERFDTPVLLRLSTRVSHSQSIVTEGERQGQALRPYEKNVAKYVMMPANARARHVVVEQRMRDMTELSETLNLNRVERGGKIGVIAAGIAYQYAREALGDRASYLKLGMVNPLPEKLIRDFTASVDRLYVIEELDDVIETHVRGLGVPVEGKALFSKLYEYTPDMLRERILGEKRERQQDAAAPGRPPVLCPGCPHRGLFHVLGKLKLTVSGDIGCYTLGATAPLSAMDSTICMGASVSALHGFNTARGRESSSRAVAVIGDSTFVHSGITGLVNIVYNGGDSTVIILDNRITGMTGHQQNPCTGLTLKGKPAPELDLAAVCRAVGVKRVREVDPFDLAATEAAIREELQAPEPSVIITKRPCALLKSVKAQPAYRVDQDRCTRCRACMRLGCPAISFTKEDGVRVDATLCTGCGLCAKVCRFGALNQEVEA